MVSFRRNLLVPNNQRSLRDLPAAKGFHIKSCNEIMDEVSTPRANKTVFLHYFPEKYVKTVSTKNMLLISCSLLA